MSFYQTVRHTSPEAQRIWIVLENWPVHFHPDVLVALEPQETPFPFSRPANWLALAQSRSSETLGGTALTDPVRAEASLCLLVQPS